MNDRLTGARRYRTTWRGKLVLQVEIEFPPYYENAAKGATLCRNWRDASVADITDHKVVD